ncbi:hypothetical protein PHLCEN_2v474 [Hermanssonia centrifuga]|uniref:Uncharacterized protein n=1 Tax=Hermanssonia centrifuga TaxID=98765 RepID=A0A2R6S5S5_9APHY|nr:hypothetical protein PHLCEN_2v474 [Hermanssonia centrifuga]
MPAQNGTDLWYYLRLTSDPVALLVFISLATEFYIRFLTDRPLYAKSGSGGSIVTLSNSQLWTTRIKLMSLGLAISTTFILIRLGSFHFPALSVLTQNKTSSSIYRTAELGDGWTGRIVRTQVYFNVLDGGMVVIAIWALNFFHPGFLMFGSSMHEDEIMLKEQGSHRHSM